MKDLNNLQEFQRTPSAKTMYEILVVDDEDIIRRLLKSILRLREDLKVTTCHSGPEALELIETQSVPFHLVISDLLMPGMSGVELLDHLKEAQPDLPILAFSGSLDGCQTPDRFDGILAKPFTLKEVHDIVEKFCPVERQF